MRRKNKRIFVDTSSLYRKPKRSARIATKKYVDRKVDEAIEDKYKILYGFSNVSYNSDIQDITGGIAQGDAYNERSGDRIKLKHIDINFTLYGANDWDFVRVILFQWKFYSAPIEGTNVLNPDYKATSHAVLSPYNKDDKFGKAMNIMYDKIHVLGFNKGGPAAKTWKVRLKRYLTKEIQFQTGTATVYKNRLYMLTISNRSAAVVPVLEYMAEIYYEDA